MAIATGVSLEEYLHTEYEPDCDYVDGVLEDRNAGKQRHGETQAAVAAFFLQLKRRLGIRVATELRVCVSATRVRIPAVAVVASEDTDEIKEKPLCCVLRSSRRTTASAACSGASTITWLLGSP